jgi:hypothetical protein
MSTCDGTEGLRSNYDGRSVLTHARVPKGEGGSDGTNGAGAVLAAPQDPLLPAPVTASAHRQGEGATAAARGHVHPDLPLPLVEGMWVIVDGGVEVHAAEVDEDELLLSNASALLGKGAWAPRKHVRGRTHRPRQGRPSL